MVGKLAKLVISGGMCVLLSASISGCSPFIPSPEEQAENAAHELLEAIQTGDPSRLSRIMSCSALDESDLFQGFSYASSLLNETKVSMKDPSTVGKYSVERGKSALIYEIGLDIKTTDHEWYLLVEYHAKNDFDRNKIGIYRAYISDKQSYEAEIDRIRALRAQASENIQPLPEWNYGATYERPGIYHPGWKDDEVELNDADETI